MNDRPLDGRTLVVTRAPEQAGELVQRLRDLGADVIEAPVLAFGDGDLAELDAAVKALDDYAAVGVTSPNGADALADALGRTGVGADALRAVPVVAAVGPGTAGQLHERLDVEATLVPDTATTASLAEAFPSPTVDGDRVLLPRADLATPLLSDTLRAKGWDVHDVIAYRTLQPDSLPPAVDVSTADAVLLASSSTAANWTAMVGPAATSIPVVSIGPVTSGTCRDLGLEVIVEADPHTIDGLVSATVAGFGGPVPTG